MTKQSTALTKSVRGAKKARRILDRLHADGRGIGRVVLANQFKIDRKTLNKFLDGKTIAKTLKPETAGKINTTYANKGPFLNWVSAQILRGAFKKNINMSVAGKEFQKTGGAIPAFKSVGKKNAVGKVTRNVTNTINASGASVFTTTDFFKLVKKHPAKTKEAATRMVIEQVRTELGNIEKVLHEFDRI